MQRGGSTIDAIDEQVNISTEEYEIEEFDIILCISCLEKALHQMGYKFELGAGVKAAEEVFLR